MGHFPPILPSLLCLLLPLASWAQTIHVSGLVIDASTRQPLPYVEITSKSNPSTQSSDEKGTFSIQTWTGDTLVFSRLGYSPTVHVIDNPSGPIVVALAEISEVLKEVIVYDRFLLPGADRWKTGKPSKPVRFENTTFTQPMRGIRPVFGPGISIRIGGRNDKQKKMREELQKTKVYTAMVTSEEVKKKLMGLYSLSEEKYYQKLEAFNKENPEVAYLTDQDEIMTLLIRFFARKNP